jgi:hypothetical protein
MNTLKHFGIKNIMIRGDTKSYSNKDICPRCGKIQTSEEYCVEWKDGDCIRMGSIAKGWKK